MQHGIVILPDQPWSHAVGRWQRAEEYGFDHAWTFDHLMWRSLRNRPWYAALPTLTAAATVTSRIRLGTLVAGPNIRHPLTFAKDVMTLDDVSAGRAICGIGAGAANGFDNHVFGRALLSGTERADRFSEFAELTSQLLHQRETSFEGQYFTARDAAMYPGCVQRPAVPLAVAASGTRAMRTAARFGQAWITLGDPAQSEPAHFEHTLPLLKDQTRLLDDACRAEGRDPADVDRIVLAGAQMGGVLDSPDSFTTAQGRIAELGFTGMIIFWPRPEEPFRGSEQRLEDIAHLLSAGSSATVAPAEEPV